MWNKIYLLVLAAATLAAIVLFYLSYSWLQSITAPVDVATNYEFYSRISWLFLLSSSLTLLVVGNIVFWTTRKSWALWTTLLYFTIFIIAYSFWLENSFFKYKQANNLASGLISWSPLLGIALIIAAALVVFSNFYLMKRAQNKMFPPEQPIESLPEESETRNENS